MIRTGMRNCICMLFALSLAACMLGVVAPNQAEAATKAPSITAVNASSGKVSIKQGATYKLGVSAPKARISYKSSKPSVVRVTSKGQVMGLKAGKATITVKAKKGKAKAVKKISVSVLSNRKYKSVKGIQVKVSSKKLTVGQTAKIKATFKPKNASNKNLIYKTSNAKVLKVSASGIVLAKGEGSAKITVTSASNKRVKKTIKLTVAPKPSSGNVAAIPKVRVSSVSASADEDVLVEGDFGQIDAMVFPWNATNQSVKYSSSNTRILSVDSYGYVYANFPGMANITVTSVDNPQAKAVVPITVIEAEYDEYEDRDPDLIYPVEIDPDYDNRIEYAPGAIVVQDADYEINEDNSITVSGGELPAGLKNGDIVVFEPTESNPSGAAIKVNDDDLDDAVLCGNTPGISEIYEEIDIESFAGVAEDDFKPEEDIEIVGSEEVPIEDAEPSGVMMVYPQSNNAVSNTQQAASGRYGLQAARVNGLNAQDDSIEAYTVGGGGKSTSKFDFKYRGVTFSVALTGKVKYDYDYWGLNELYVGVEAKNTVGIKGKVSDIFGAEDIDKKLGEATFTTPVPGLFLEGSVWFHLGADGEVNLSLKSSCEAGVRYTESDGIRVVAENSTQPELKTSVEVDTGLDFVGTLKLLAMDVADPSLNIRFKLGVDSHDAKVRSNGIRCNDIKLKFAPAITIGKHQGLLKSMGISYSKKITEITLKKWHLENGNIVNRCTWKGNFKDYEGVRGLLPNDGGMGSWANGDALRITLQWGAYPEDLDSHLYGPSTYGSYHIYFGNKDYSDDVAIKAFLDVDNTQGNGFETTTVYDATDGLYHFMIDLFSGSSGTIGSSGATVNVYKGDELLKSFVAPTDFDDDHWYVFSYDARTNSFYPYSYNATDDEYDY